MSTVIDGACETMLTQLLGRCLQSKGSDLKAVSVQCMDMLLLRGLPALAELELLRLLFITGNSDVRMELMSKILEVSKDSR